MVSSAWLRGTLLSEAVTRACTSRPAMMFCLVCTEIRSSTALISSFSALMLTIESAVGAAEAVAPGVDGPGVIAGSVWGPGVAHSPVGVVGCAAALGEPG